MKIPNKRHPFFSYTLNQEVLSSRGSLLLLLLFSFFSISAEWVFSDPIKATHGDAAAEHAWVDSIYNLLSEDERLGQLFMIRAHSDKGKDHEDQVRKLIKEYHIGGLCFFQGTPEKQARLTNEYQALTNHLPLMISMDAEWGLGMRLKNSTISFPKALMLGAIQDNRLIYDMGKEIARQCRRLGVHINFAPVADVNNNPKNPVINTRSFGEDRLNVSVKSYMYMMGLQDGNVMACAKHFPGHGDTDVDSHLDLPVISHDMQRLDSIELFPFQVLAEQGIQSMMVAHLNVPSIDDTPNLPTTLSPRAVSRLLKDGLGFEGLIFTDGLGMKGVTKHYKSGEVEAKALVAGNDVLLLPQDVAASFKEIKNYIQSGKLSPERIEESVRKVLHAKYKLGLTVGQKISTTNLDRDLNSQEAKVLKRRLIANALTLVRNDAMLIPIKNVSQKISSLSIGSSSTTPFQASLKKYASIKTYQSPKDISSSKQGELLNKLKNDDVVVVSFHDMSSYASKKFGLSESAKTFVNTLRRETKVILTVFGNPYSLKDFDEIDHLLLAYDEDEMTQDLAAQAIFGSIPITGKMPVTASSKSKYNDGLASASLFRLTYGLPESVGLNSSILTSKIDELAKEAIDMKATPGCVVLVAKDGKVVFEKAYGHHTYDKKTKTSINDIYDVASMTKIAATTISIMKLYDEGKLSIYDPISQYLPGLNTGNKKDLLIQDMMAHRAGLTPWIPFYEQTLTGTKRPKPSSEFYKKTATDGYSIPVTDKLFLKDDFVSEIKKQIRDSELLSTIKYKYSDLAFYLLADLVQQQTGKRLDRYVDDNFYEQMGLTTACFNPLNYHSKLLIPPSEDDTYWRNQKVQGYVHDMGAAMLGGVSGHAGLFSNANDIAIIMQMLLNRGYYGGQQFLRPETVQLFTRRHSSCTRRGIGFDMKELDVSKSQNMSDKASSNTFGHLGFTGTATWVDPDHNIIFIFLSNRTYPSMKNSKLYKEDFRPRIQTAIYDALEY